ncbi:hypothetical protein [Pedobacter sp. MR2016-24]|uniref:hypothetical protein n=1 Tax=Pedobacter sp. MR2016-24 TaxID=2994466 RepID=UPI002247F8D9|nr:hypothetical protein [Pedobacter sp. MR2016-24]MCX2482522.1 hypothetical protein [Pedobacter sp. MR2016-24]
MRKSILLLAGIAGIIAACQNKTTEQKADSLAKSPDTAAMESKACYISLKNRDTVSLSLNQVEDAVTGELSYNLFEKDKNTGTVAGIIKGDTISLDYSFLSEGSSSVRQVIFLKKGDQLIEGYGPSEEKNGKTIFKDRTAVKFGEGIILSKTDCK